MIPFSEQTAFQNHIPQVTHQGDLEYFYANAYHDMRFFLKAITQTDSNSCVFFGDMQKDLYYISDNMMERFGFPSHIVHGFFQEWEKRIHGQRWRKIFTDAIGEIYSQKRDLVDLRQQVADRNGKVLWIRFYAAVQWNEDKSKPLFFACRVSRQDNEFSVDPTTNFPTMSTLQKYLCSIHDISFTAVGFCYNYMPQINSKYGRIMADQMIENASRRMMDAFGDRVSFYRLPGVRCLALTNHWSQEELDRGMEQIHEIIYEEYRNLGVLVPKACSFAILHFPHKGLSPEYFQETMVSLLKLARREPNLAYVEDSDRNIDRIHEHRTMEMAVKKDVMSGMKNFRAVIQPIVNTNTGKIVGGETLLRWKYQDRDVSPGLFIPILETDDMIHVAGRWVMEQAIKACKQITEYLPDFYLSVNISLQQLHDPILLDFILQTLNKYGLDGHHLVVETTESCMDKEPARIQNFIDVCHRQGIRIALDDFGTGYSSLRVLLKYATDIIKLDRSLLLEMSESAAKSSFINSIVFACHQFGKIVCMEGVETAEHRDLVRDAGCDTIQGFYFYRPMEIEEVYKVAEQQKE